MTEDRDEHSDFQLLPLSAYDSVIDALSNSLGTANNLLDSIQYIDKITTAEVFDMIPAGVNFISNNQLSIINQLTRQLAEQTPIILDTIKQISRTNLDIAKHYSELSKQLNFSIAPTAEQLTSLSALSGKDFVKKINLVLDDSPSPISKEQRQQAIHETDDLCNLASSIKWETLGVGKNDKPIDTSTTDNPSLQENEAAQAELTKVQLLRLLIQKKIKDWWTASEGTRDAVKKIGGEIEPWWLLFEILKVLLSLFI